MSHIHVGSAIVIIVVDRFQDHLQVQVGRMLLAFLVGFGLVATIIIVVVVVLVVVAVVVVIVVVIVSDWHVAVTVVGPLMM